VAERRARSWVHTPPESDFTIDNLPYGVFAQPGDHGRIGVAIGDNVLDLAAVADAGLLSRVPLPTGAFFADSLNQILEAGPDAWAALRKRVRQLLDFDNREVDGITGLKRRALLDQSEVEMLLPVAIGDYVDFYSSEQHATNMGRLFRPDADPLLPNWRHIPIGYHGRSSSVVVSGTPVKRFQGQTRAPGQEPAFGPTRKLDIELEVGFITGPGQPPGETIPVDDAEDYIFGLVLVNDWSARDVQAWEYQPLGPYLGKSFATSISPWVVPLAALEPYRVPAPAQDPEPFAYLRESDRRGLDLRLEVAIKTAHMRRPEVLSRVNFSTIYWTMAQQLAHTASNGAPVRAGDLYASGTISGSDPGSYGSLIEMTVDGREPLQLSTGETRTFLEDGDTMILRGYCGGGNQPRVGFGQVVGQVVG
jgi:fumarylacetoacetase